MDNFRKFKAAERKSASGIDGFVGAGSRYAGRSASVQRIGDQRTQRLLPYPMQHRAATVAIYNHQASLLFLPPKSPDSAAKSGQPEAKKKAPGIGVR
jgi:hypothetical protein